MIVVLAGGVGAARFLQGIVQIIPQNEIVTIVNTGDDRDFYGLHISPDIDIIMYTLAGVVHPEQGWGIHHDTYKTMAQLSLLGYEQWFSLGDKDLATHIHRTKLLHEGKSLSEVTEDLIKRFGLTMKVIPMSNQSIQTYINTPQGLLHFQEYMVKHQCRDEVLDVRFVGIEHAQPSPGVIDAIITADAVLLAPSNPVVSIGSILSVPGIRTALKKTTGKVVAVSPLVNGMPIKGPADKLMKGVHMEVSAAGVADAYRDFLDIMVVDIKDKNVVSAIEKLGIKVVAAQTIMHDQKAKKELAQIVLQQAEIIK